jgi:hypothetical protein
MDENGAEGIKFGWPPENAMKKVGILGFSFVSLLTENRPSGVIFWAEREREREMVIQNKMVIHT